MMRLHLSRRVWLASSRPVSLHFASLFFSPLRAASLPLCSLCALTLSDRSTSFLPEFFPTVSAASAVMA